MSAGTISIQNNAAAVAGAGTAFTTEFSAGDFIVITTGGVTYTLPVKSIESDTALTLARNYNGPAVTAGAWTAMPRDTLNRISAQIAADTAYAIRQRVLEIDNWYQLLEVNGDVTIKMADGSSYTGPSWLKLIDVMKEMQIDQIIPIAEQIRADAQQVADDKLVIIQAKDDAEAAAIAAAASEENASTSESNAASSASTASTKADEAAESARQAAESNPLLALQKSLNLQDLPDKSAARSELDVFSKAEVDTHLEQNGVSSSLTVNDLNSVISTTASSVNFRYSASAANSPDASTGGDGKQSTKDSLIVQLVVTNTGSQYRRSKNGTDTWSAWSKLAFNESDLVNTPWIPLTIGSGWSVIAGNRASFRKALGCLQLDLHVTGGTFSDGTVIATLPAGSRPIQNQGFLLISLGAWNNSYPPRMFVQTNGQIAFWGLGGNGPVDVTAYVLLQ
ncbi:pyocin knob domain-containing protein [Kluyvera ascorbata]|uniref:pyocin knob domain-containing protein n=1 Tax=Kluyvera ascorbata TaxID=51288 RepID=UPI00350FF11C